MKEGHTRIVHCAIGVSATHWSIRLSGIGTRAELILHTEAMKNKGGAPASLGNGV